MVTEIDKLKRIKQLKELLVTIEDMEERRAYIIQLDTLLPKTDKILRIDADGFFYMVAYAPSYKKEDVIDGGTFIANDEEIIKTRFKDYKLHFKALVADIVSECKYHSVMGSMARFSSYELVFTRSTNFRYDVYPDYKKSRLDKPQSITLKRLKKWAKASLGIVPDGVEADDYCYYYGMKGHPVATGDKDVYNSITGGTYFHHSMNRKVITTTKEEADRFILLQSLAGDSSDDIPGIKGVGMKNKLLPENATFDDVIQIYIDKGYTKEDAILTRRLIGLDQYNARNGKVRLFTWD